MNRRDFEEMNVYELVISLRYDVLDIRCLINAFSVVNFADFLTSTAGKHF